MIMVYIFAAIFIAISIMIISIVTCRVSIHSVCKGDPCPPQLCWCTSLKVAISITIVKPNEVKNFNSDDIVRNENGRVTPFLLHFVGAPLVCVIISIKMISVTISETR